MKRRLVPMFLALLAIAASCSTAVPDASPPAGITVTDALGRTVTLPQLPQRIVTAGRGVFMLNNALFMFPEARARVVALGKADQGAQDFLALLDPALGEKPLLETQVSAEQIAPLQPDLVILKSYMAESLGQPLEAIGIPVLYLELEKPDQYGRDLLILGRVLGNTARAEDLAAYYAERLQQVETALQGLSQTDRPSVLLLRYSESGGAAEWQVPPAGWIQTTLVERAGGIAVWKEAAAGGGWTTVNLEQVAAWNPDWIIVIQYIGDAGETTARLQENSQWRELRATQANHLVPFPKDYVSWDQPDPRWPLGLTWLATTLHPRYFSMTTEEVVVDFYRQVYGLDEAATRANILPRVVGIDN